MIDTHVNLHHHLYENDLEEVLNRAHNGGIDGMLTICDRIENFGKIHEIIANRQNYWMSVGAHPHEAKHHLQMSVDDLVDFSKNPKVVGIGETGLDFHYNLSPHDEQIKVFETHIHAAQQTQLPLIVHTREADNLMGDILCAEFKNKEFPLELHCYTSGSQLLKRGLDIGAYVSISGIATFKNAQDVRDNIQYIPNDRLLVETDCPYLAPIPKRGQRNEPLFVNFVAEYLANFLKRDLNELSQELDNNFFKLFKKAQG